tara:strand:+ start:61 stop:543 length:483 start_codon:yes stop_codon:yes gene_type:complete
MTEQETKKKGRWKPKVYSRQLMEYANQSLRDDEKNLYKTLFDEIKTSNGIEKVEHLMMLDTTIYDFIRIKRIHNIIMREGDVVRLKLRGGQVITKAHEASYLLNAVQTQFRNNMKELMLTKKEIVKKNIGLGVKDFASFMSETAVDADFEVKEDKSNGND